MKGQTQIDRKRELLLPTTHQPTSLPGIAQDALIMNLDDLLCVGVTDNILLSSTIGRNKNLITGNLNHPPTHPPTYPQGAVERSTHPSTHPPTHPPLHTGEVLAAIINGTQELLDELAGWGVQITSTGGETADVGDLVRTIIVDSTVTARVKRAVGLPFPPPLCVCSSICLCVWSGWVELICTIIVPSFGSSSTHPPTHTTHPPTSPKDIIDNAKIQAGDLIVGLSSYGQATYEKEYNGGMGSNGLTSARHDVFGKALAEKYPESFDPHVPTNLIYSGSKSLTDAVEGSPIDAGKLVLSPTRTYAPVIKRMLDKHRADIHGMVHCSGGK